MSLIGLLAHAAKAAESYTENSGAEGEGNYTIGPAYKIDPDLTDRGNPKGKYFEFTMRLAVVRFFHPENAVDTRSRGQKIARNEPDAKAILPEPRSVKKTNSYQSVQ